MSKEDVKNEEVAAEEEAQEESTEVVEGKIVEPKVSKLMVAKVFLKNNWKKIAIGAAVTVAGAVVYNKLKEQDEPIEGEYTEVEEDGTEDSVE